MESQQEPGPLIGRPESGSLSGVHLWQRLCWQAGVGVGSGVGSSLTNSDKRRFWEEAGERWEARRRRRRRVEERMLCDD